MPLPTRPLALLLVCASPMLLGGCLAKTAVDVVTLPVRAAGKAVDLMTTSQEEADRNRGRDMRIHEAELGKLQRRQDKASARCADGDSDGCEDARSIAAEIEQLDSRHP